MFELDFKYVDWENTETQKMQHNTTQHTPRREIYRLSYQYTYMHKNHNSILHHKRQNILHHVILKVAPFPMKGGDWPLTVKTAQAFLPKVNE